MLVGVRVLRTETELREAGIAGCVLVPTMGALHEGHLALIRQGVALSRAEGSPGGCVVSIFVNPTQFNDPRDFDRYPRDAARDLALCEGAGVDAVFQPAPEVVYPPGVEVPVPALPPVATRPGLEDAHRPGHFEGVCQVVRRLFELVRPGVAVFGEKDWQQLLVIGSMVEAEGLPIRIEPGPTVREADGLAMSSRNALLDPDARVRAGSLWAALRAAGGVGRPEEAERAMRRVLDEAGLETEYAVVRDAWTLEAYRAGEGRALVAAWAGGVRLIDNAPWPRAGD